MTHHEYEKMFNTVYHQEKQIKSMVTYHVSTRMTKNNKTTADSTEWWAKADTHIHCSQNVS